MFKRETIGSGIKDLDNVETGLELLEKGDYRTPYTINRPVENINYNVTKVIDFLENSAVFSFSGGIFKNTTFDMDLSMAFYLGNGDSRHHFLNISPGAGVVKRSEIDVDREDLAGKEIPNNIFFSTYPDLKQTERILNKIHIPDASAELGDAGFELKMTPTGLFKARNLYNGTYDYFINTDADDLTNWEDDQVGQNTLYELLIYINSSTERSGFYTGKIFTALDSDLSKIPSTNLIPITTNGQFLISTDENGRIVMLPTTWSGSPDPSNFKNDLYFVLIGSAEGGPLDPEFNLATTYDEREWFARETQFNAGDVEKTFISRENNDGSITTLFNIFSNPNSRVEFWKGEGIGATKIMEIGPDNVNIVVSTTEIDVGQLSTTDPLLTLNKNGNPLGSSLSGLEIERDGEDSYYIVFDEETETFKVGTSPDGGVTKTELQAIATRENTPLDGGVAVWNAGDNRFDTVDAGSLGVDVFAEELEFKDYPKSLSLSNHNRSTSQIYNGKLYLPQDNGTEMDIVDLSDNSKITISTLSNHGRQTSQIYNGKLYLPRNGGINMDIVDLSDNSKITISTLSNHGRLTSQIYNGKLYLPRSDLQGMDIVDLSDNSKITISTLSIYSRATSQIYNGKLYLPQNGGINMDIVDLSDNSVTTISTLSNHNRSTSQIYNGKLYLPQNGGINMDIVDLSDNSVTTISTLSSHQRLTSQIYNGKLYLPQENNVNMDIVDLSDNSVITISTLSSHSRSTSQIYNGKLYLPQNNGTGMDIVDLSDNSMFYKTISLSNHQRSTSQIYNGKLYLPQNSGTGMDIVDLSDNSKITISTLSSHQRHTSQIYNGKLYLPQSSGTNMDIVDLSDNSKITISTLSSHQRLTSQIYNGKLYLPQDDGVNMDIVDLSDNSKITISTLSSFSRNTSQIYNGKLYLPQSIGTNMDIVDLSDNSKITISTLSSHLRSTSQIYNGKLYLPQSGGTGMDIVDLSDNSVTTISTLSNHYRLTSQIYNGKLYLPQSSGTNMDIVDLSDNSKITISTLSSHLRYTSQIYNGKLYLPQNSGTSINVIELRTFKELFYLILKNFGYI